MAVPLFNLGLTEILFFGVLAAAVVGAMVYMFSSGKDRKDE
jgi:hypothetical protein